MNLVSGVLKRSFLTVMLMVILCTFVFSGDIKNLADTQEMHPALAGYLEIRNTKDQSQLDPLIAEHIASDYVLHFFPYNDLVGHTAYKDYVECSQIAYPDYFFQFDEVIESDDKYVCRWTMTGTNTGPYGSCPPTGQAIIASGLSIFRIAEGKIAEEWLYFNKLSVLEQLGYTVTSPCSK